MAWVIRGWAGMVWIIGRVALRLHLLLNK